MIKRLIFDLDNTLISWNNDYYKTFNIVLDKMNYQYDDYFVSKLIKSINNYEKEHLTYNKREMLEFMNKYTNRELPDDFMDLWLEELCYCSEEASRDIIETLEYLYGKYDLVILTNWFAYSQIKRLEKAGILKYFNSVYCADSFPMKPNLESYLVAAGSYKTSDCIMIGDSIEVDMDGAKKAGMNTIYYNYNNNKNNNKKYKEIKEIISLKNML